MLHVLTVVHIIWLLDRHGGMANRTIGCLTEISRATFEQSGLSLMLHRKLCRPWCSVDSMACQVYAWHYIFNTCAYPHAHCFVLHHWYAHVSQLVGQSVNCITFIIDHTSMGLAQAHPNHTYTRWYSYATCC